MKPKAKRTVNLLSALLMTGALIGNTAHAQESGTSLPLTSAGGELSWAAGDPSLTLTVAAQGPVKLELQWSRPDSASTATPAGSVTLILTDAQGREVLTRTVTPGEQTWNTLIDQELQPGT